MTISITLRAETEQKLRDRAARAGQDVESVIRELIEQGVDAKPTLDEILAQFRRQVSESGTSDEELQAIFETARDEVAKAKRADDRP